jgi:predicted small secreted protein
MKNTQYSFALHSFLMISFYYSKKKSCGNLRFLYLCATYKNMSDFFAIIIKKMKTIKIIFSAVVAIFLFAACGDTKCPAFGEDVFAWVPYQVDDEVYLVENYSYALNYDTLHITNVDTEHTSSVAYNADCDCNNALHISIVSDKSLEIYIQFSSTESLKIEDAFIIISTFASSLTC